MIVTTDELGEWYQMGLLKPTDYNKWYDLTPEHEVHTGRYRLSFSCNNFPKIQSFAWIRSVYIKGNQELYSRSTRVYPHPVGLDIPLPIPSDYLSAGIIRQKLQIKKLFKRYKSTDWLWSIKVEEFYLERQQSQNTFLLSLTKVTRLEQHPEEPDLFITVFEEQTGFGTYEVGRFYTYSTNEIVSDPIVETYPNLLRTTFTSRQPIAPNSIKVRIVA